MRARMQQEHRTRDLVLLNLGIDSKLRGCDLVALRVRDIQHSGQIAPRAIITQHKTGRPVQFKITPPTRASVETWIREARLTSDDERPPPQDLADVVHVFWELRTLAPLPVDFLHHAVPDACVNLLFNQIDLQVAGVTGLHTVATTLNLGTVFHYVGVDWH